jgi:hypothetical protein
MLINIPALGGTEMGRTPQEVFSDHLAAIARRDIGAISKDYTDDAVLITAQGALEGRAGVEQFYAQVLESFPDLELHVTSTVYAKDALLVRWTSTASAGRVDDGVDTFSFAAGQIRLHTLSFTVEPNQP